MAPPSALPMPKITEENENAEAAGGKTKPDAARRASITGAAAAASGPHRGPKPNSTRSSSSSAVSFCDCRPSSYSKPSVTPLHPHGHHPSPHSFLSLFRGRSPRAPSPSDNEWRLVATEISRKLLVATRKRDEALSESARLQLSVSDLQRQLALLDRPSPLQPEPFHRYVSASRSAVRRLARAISPLAPAAAGLGDTEALLNRVFYAGFELDDEDEARHADPADRCRANRDALESVRELKWEEVLSRGTRHYSEALSRFCDRRMSQMVGALGWAPKAWAEGVLRAYFDAAKAAWMVRLLARSVHPPVPIMRVDRGTRFDPRFMEDVAVGRAGVERLEPVSVRVMVAPGFHLYTCSSAAIKSKVSCTYRSCGGRGGGSSVKM